MLVTLSDDADLRQVQGYYALVEAAFKLIIAIFVLPRGQEAAAAHGAEHIALVVFAHFLGANIVRIHTLSTAFYSQASNIIVFAALQAVQLIQHIHQFGESRSYIHALVVFNALQALTQNFFYDHSIFLQIRIILAQVQKQSYEGGLTVGGHQGIDLVLNGLYATL